MNRMTTTGPSGRHQSPSGTTLVQFNVNDRHNLSDQADSAFPPRIKKAATVDNGGG
jgi:hypothetical protein